MSKFRRRTLTRLAAVQALFHSGKRSDIHSLTLKNFLDEANRLQDNALKGLDKELLTNLVTGTKEQLNIINPIIKNNLSTSWNFDRIDPVIISILQLASFELLNFTNLSPSIIINEYLDVAYSFYNTEEEKKFINGVLNAISTTVRE